MIDVEPMLTDLDDSRARVTDHPNSHLAADASQAGLSALRLAVLRLVAAEGPLIGSEINDAYHDAHRTNPERFPVCASESPRKRAGELCEKFSLLEHSGDRVADDAHMKATPQAEYRVNDAGWAYLRKVSEPDIGDANVSAWFDGYEKVAGS